MLPSEPQLPPEPDSKLLKESLIWKVEDFFSDTEIFYTNIQCSKFNKQVKWQLQIHPAGYGMEDHVSIFLQNGSTDFSNEVTVKFRGQIIDEFGSTLHRQLYELRNFSNVEDGYGWFQFVRKDLLKLIIASTNGDLILKIDLEYLEFNYEIEVEEKLVSSPRYSLPYNTYNDIDESTGLFLKSYENMIDGYLTDFTFEFKNGLKISVHKAILAPKWQYFNNLLESNMKEAQESKLIVIDHEYATIKSLLVFLYTNTIKFDTFDELLALFKVAHIYGVTDLIKTCLVFIKRNLTLNEVVRTILFAHQYDSKELKKMAFEVIVSSTNIFPRQINKFEDIPDHEQLDYKIHGQIIFELLVKFIEMC